MLVTAILVDSSVSSISMIAMNLGDYISPSKSSAENLAGWNAAMAAPNPGGEVLIPVGDFYFSGTLNVTKRIILKGQGTHQSRFVFYATTGMRVAYPTPSLGDGGGSILQDFGIYHATSLAGGFPQNQLIPVWRPNLEVHDGDFYIPATIGGWAAAMAANQPPNYGVAWQVTTPGDTGTVEPSWPNENPKSSITGTRTCTFDISTDEVSVAAHGWSNGQKLRFATSGALPGGLTTTGAFYVRDATTNAFKVADSVGGPAINLSGSPSGTQWVSKLVSPDFTPIVDGSVTWTPKVVDGLQIQRNCTVFNLLISGFPGNNITVNASSRYEQAPTYDFSNANLFSIRRCESLYGGQGLFICGADANAGSIEEVNLTGNRWIAGSDYSELGNSWRACHVDQSGGSYVSPGSRFTDCYVEDNTPVPVIGGSWDNGVSLSFSGTNYHRDIQSTQRNHAYVVGDWIRPTTPNGFDYVCVGSGTSAASEPTWPPCIDIEHVFNPPDAYKVVTDGTAKFAAYSFSVVSNGRVSTYGNRSLQHRFYNRDDNSYFCPGGSDGGVPAAFSFGRSGGSEFALQFDATNNWWALKRDSLDPAILYLGAAGSAMEAGKLGFSAGFMLRGIGWVKIDAGPGVDPARSYGTGSFRFNEAPAGNQPLGWSCIAGAASNATFLPSGYIPGAESVKNNASYQILATDATVFAKNLASSDKTFTLPALSGCYEGQLVTVGDLDGSAASGHALIIDGSGSEQIDGANTLTTTTARSKLTLKAVKSESVWTVVSRIGTWT